MSMHAKTDSEVTSLTASSPTRSPRRPVYYVQSPSRDSHDGEKTTNSFHSTPVLSPSASPGHHSRDSSSTRFSGSLKPGSRKGHQQLRKGRNDFGAIEEEGLLDDDDTNRGFPRRCCYFLTFVIGFSVLFTMFSLILWGAARPQKPIVTVNTITFNDFLIQAGNDGSGVATDMLSMNSTVKFVFRNTGTFFGVHVASSPLDLSFSDLTIASGNVKRFYQSRKSQRTLTVTLRGSYTPLYGGSSYLSSKDGQLIAPATLNLNFIVRARGYVLGKLVKPKFYKRVHCSVVIDPKKMNVAISLKKACTYK